MRNFFGIVRKEETQRRVRADWAGARGKSTFRSGNEQPGGDQTQQVPGGVCVRRPGPGAAAVRARKVIWPPPKGSSQQQTGRRAPGASLPANKIPLPITQILLGLDAVLCRF